MALHIVHELSRTGIYSRPSHYESKGDIIIKRNTMIGDIPVLNCFIDDGAKKPLFLFFHGYTQNKESNMQIIYELAAEGFFVVAPDCAGHGERENREGHRMCGLLQKTTNEVDTIIDYFANEAQADISRLFIAGASFGGVVTYSYLAFGNHPVKAAASLSSTPDLEAMLRLPLGFIAPDMASGKRPFTPPSDEEKAETFALGEKISPLNHWQAIAKTPLIMIHGTDDEVVPLAGEEILYDRLSPNASDDDLQLHHFQGCGHASSPDMKNCLIDWFCNKRNA